MVVVIGGSQAVCELLTHKTLAFDSLAACLITFTQGHDPSLALTKVIFLPYPEGPLDLWCNAPVVCIPTQPLSHFLLIKVMLHSFRK